MVIDELAEIQKSLNNMTLNTQVEQLKAEIKEIKDQIKSK